MECHDTSKSFTIFIYPWGDPVNEASGVAKRSLRLLLTLLGTRKKAIVISPVLIDSIGIQSRKFLSLNGHGGLVIDLNPTYHVIIVKTIKALNGCGDILLTGPLGIFGASLVKLLFSRKAKVSITYDAHNVEKERLAQKSITKSKLSAPFFVTKIIFLVSEFLATKLADYILSVSWEDKRKFMELYRVPPERIVVVPSNISSAPLVDRLTVPKLRKKLGRPVCVFHGTYNYLPNKEAVDTIIREIAPKVPEAYFFIAGKGVPKDMLDVPENVKLVGFVDNLEEFLASCDIAVVPLKRGAGTKLKMYDYMRVGLAIVTTRKGAEGLGLVNGKHSIIVDEVGPEFIMEIQKLVAEPKKRIKLGRNARKLLDTKQEKLREYLFKRDGSGIHGKI